MASDYALFWQTLVAESSRVTAPLTSTNSILKATWRDVKPAQAAIGQTININIPSNVDSSIVDAPYADPTFSEYDLTQVSVVINKKPQYGTIIRSFEQYNSPQDIMNVLLLPGVQGVARKANAYLAALLVTGNFTRTTAVATTASTVTTAQFLDGQQQLIENFVDVLEPGNMTFIQSPAVFKSQQKSTDWTQESIAGINQANDARRDGALKVAYGATMTYDQGMPRTGSAGSYVYTSAYLSRVALVAAFRPLPPGGPGTETTYMVVDGIPMRVMLSYQHTKDAWLLSVDCGMGCAVARPEQGVLFTTAQ